MTTLMDDLKENDAVRRLGAQASRLARARLSRAAHALGERASTLGSSLGGAATNGTSSVRSRVTEASKKAVQSAKDVGSHLPLPSSHGEDSDSGEQPAKRTARQAPRKRAGTRPAARKQPARKAAATKSAPRKATATKSTPRKAAAKSAPRKAAAKKSAPRKAAAKKSTTRRASPRKATAG